MSTLKKLIVGCILVIAGLVLFGLLKNSDTKLGGLVHTLQEDFTAGIRVGGTEVISKTRELKNVAIGSVGAGLNFFEKTTSVAAATTLTTADSGKTLYITTTGAAYTLPAVASSDGVALRFVVGAAFSTNAVITSAEGDNVEGALIVAGAVVDCDANDVITFVADGENLGDYVEIRSNGSKWYIGSSGALTASKLTCTG